VRPVRAGRVWPTAEKPWDGGKERGMEPAAAGGIEPTKSYVVPRGASEARSICFPSAKRAGPHYGAPNGAELGGFPAREYVTVIVKHQD